MSEKKYFTKKGLVIFIRRHNIDISFRNYM